MTFDSTEDYHCIIDLAEVDSSDGTHRFMLGMDGVFTDVNGNEWIGSALLESPRMDKTIGGGAPEGSISMSYFQPPGDDDLITTLVNQGSSYIFGREIRFYINEIDSMPELYAPVKAPQLIFTRTMRTLSYQAEGPDLRTLTLGFEAWTEDRRAVRRIQMNTEGHSQLLGGESNPSLSRIPTTNYQEEPLFG